MAEILLMEDTGPLRRILCHALREDGHVVVDSEDGAISYDRTVVGKADVAITDIDMPRVNGIEAILTMQKIAPDLPIIAISAGGTGDDDDYLNVCRDLGAVTVMRKPVEPCQIVDAVRAALAR